MDFADKNIVRYSLGALLFLLALNAFGGGFYGMAGAKNIPLHWLRGSPFNNYFLPGLFLFVVIGISAFIAAVAVFCRWQTAHIIALACGVTTILWLVIQVAIIGFVSWMQPATAIVALLILFLTRLLGKRVVQHKRDEA